MKICKALLIRKTDMEDGWVNGISIPVSDSCDTYQLAFDELKSILSSEDFVKEVITTFYLCDLIDDYDNKEFKYSSIEFQHGSIIYSFRNTNDEEVCLNLSLDFISTVII